MCNYSRSAPTLQLTPFAGAGGINSGETNTGGGTMLKFTLDAPAPAPPPSAPRLSSPRPLRNLPLPSPGFRIPLAGPVVAGPTGSYEVTPADYAALERFRSRSVLTIGTAGTRHLYSEGALGLAATDPFLWHVFLAFALLHDTHLSPSSSDAAHRASLAFHWYHGTALFHRNLSLACRLTESSSSSIPGTHRDALWAAAAMLGSAACALVGSTDPRDAWPLKPPDPTDLDWLKMSDGKRVVWALADPTRPDSVFHAMARDQVRKATPQGHLPIPPSALPGPFFRLCRLSSPASTPESNPYHVAASVLAQLLPRPPDDDAVIQFLAFLSQLDARYRRLLEEKDPPAVLLLAYWYAKLAGFKRWWLAKRAWVEGKAICLWLDRECPDNEAIVELLAWPKSVFFGGEENTTPVVHVMQESIIGQGVTSTGIVANDS